MDIAFYNEYNITTVSIWAICGNLKWNFADFLDSLIQGLISIDLTLSCLKFAEVNFKRTSNNANNYEITK